MTVPPPVVTRVRVQNFKSIKGCDVALGPLAILVGPNGSGKSNFLDALRFTADAVTTTLDLALRDRGGINEVRRRSSGHPNHFAVRLDLQLPSGGASYAFKVGAVTGGGFRVTDEECIVQTHIFGSPDISYRIRNGEVISTTLDERLPAVSDQRLFLVSMSSNPHFRPLYDLITSMGFYNLSPTSMRQPQHPDAGVLLRRDGSNLAAVLGHMETSNPDALARIVDYLKKVAPGVEGVTKRTVGPIETVEFKQRVAGRPDPWAFPAGNISDGTLRGLGVLVALLQANGAPPSLIGIEEPEVALHPAAVSVLIDAIRDASLHRQVLVTSHSPELLDREDLGSEAILAVQARDGITVIGPLDEVGKKALRDQLFTAGELLRLNQLQPDDESRAIVDQQLRLFELR